MMVHACIAEWKQKVAYLLLLGVCSILIHNSSSAILPSPPPEKRSTIIPPLSSPSPQCIEEVCNQSTTVAATNHSNSSLESSTEVPSVKDVPHTMEIEDHEGEQSPPVDSGEEQQPVVNGGEAPTTPAPQPTVAVNDSSIEGSTKSVDEDDQVPGVLPVDGNNGVEGHILVKDKRGHRVMDEQSPALAGITMEGESPQLSIPVTTPTEHSVIETTTADLKLPDLTTAVLNNVISGVDYALDNSSLASTALPSSLAPPVRNFTGDDGVRSEAIQSIEDEVGLDGSQIAGIVVGIVGATGIIIGIAAAVVYRQKGLWMFGFRRDNLSVQSGERSNYLDDSFTISSNTDLPKDAGDEMLSLDNDSFLNSLESMSCSNYWDGDVRHTKL